MKFLYKYPQKKFPYQQLIDENAKRGKDEKEYQLYDTGIFEEDRYWDIFIETAKEENDPDELLFRVTAWNRGPDPAPLHILPHVWFRNTWAWGREPEENKPSIGAYAENMAKARHHKLGDRYVLLSPSPGVGFSGNDVLPEMLFTENDTNFELLYEGKNKVPYVKDAFHRHVVGKEKGAINPAQKGTKCAAWYQFTDDGGVLPGECAGMCAFSWPSPLSSLFCFFFLFLSSSTQIPLLPPEYPNALCNVFPSAGQRSAMVSLQPQANSAL